MESVERLMPSNIKRWRKIAKRIAVAEGVSHVRFYPINKSIFYEDGQWLLGVYRYGRICTITFCTKQNRNYPPIGNLIHEIAHSVDHKNRAALKHDKRFRKILNSLRRKYIWGKK